ncbi:MAG: hypothetical protein EXX96DRAFT_579691 [Benjaminiella poitrasii]|nr:MAG: hypothetical protein EXX96DRAFT_579691 [Benjaminiella poitrasii]
MNPAKESRGSAESFVVFGTAFPEQTEKDKRAGRSDAGQFVPVWKQEARDEQGRRRFHGAFTGGFSAGYFNTVGSKEGWEPTNYVSSRNSRNEKKQARPEDFMDEEDLQDMTSARKLVATEEFDTLGGTERELAARRQHQREEEERGGALSFLGTGLIDMFGPPRDSIGIRLLRKMGWRPGQGIGPRLHRRRLDDDDDDDDDTISSDITFAPRDTPIENFQPKRDTYGLGYNLSLSAPEIAEMKRLRELAQQKERDGTAVDKKKRSAFGVFDPSNEDESRDAFGLGVFDNENDDDIYYGQGTSLKNYHTSLYDDDDEDGYTLDTLKSRKLQQQKRYDKDSQRKTKDSSLLKCSDGRPPLTGFHLSQSSQNQQLGAWYPPPNVPANFTGEHVATTTESSTLAKKITSDSVFSFEERGRVLGEKPIEQRSVFDYLPQHSKDRLDQAINFIVEQKKDKSQLSDFPTVSKEVANLALRGFIPFGDNPKKQARYKSYLENQAGLHSEDGIPKTSLPIPDGLTYESGMKELDEFAKAARIFRPISAMMSGRFTSASETTKHETVQFEGGLKTEEQYRKEKEEKVKETVEPKKQLSQEAEAAAMNMFGNLTRTVKPFYPNRLVCKRFNVRNPHPDHEFTADNATGRTQAGSKDALSKESMETLLNERLPLKFTSVTPEEVESSLIVHNDPAMKAVIPKPSERQQDTEVKAPITGISITTDKNDEEDEGPPLDYERPSMDIFKAIFDNSDTEEEEEEPNDNITHEVTQLANEVGSKAAAEDDEFIGPPAPPPASTADIPITTISPSSTSTEPFRPMFRRSIERKEQQSDPVIPNIISEEVLVQPFKPRSSGHRRRHVSVSESEDEKDSRKKKSSRKRDEEDKERSLRKHSRHHKSRRKRSRERSESPESSRHRHRHKKSSSSKSSSHRHRSHEKEDIILNEGIWVEKEPVATSQESSSSSNRRQKSSDIKSRMRAADMW